MSGKNAVPESVIILSRMYAGSYLKDKIGHEVINMFRADNGKNYVYINEGGYISPKYNDAVEAIYLVRYVELGVMEVIAKAIDLKQVLYKTGDSDYDSREQDRYIDDNQIKYGGIALNEIYDEGITISFEAGKILKPNQPLYLIEDAQKRNKYTNFAYLPVRHFSRQSLKMYYSRRQIGEDYKVLNKLLNDDSKWEKRNTTPKIDIDELYDEKRRITFLNIIKKEYDELVYSNLLAHFFTQNRRVFLQFTEEVLGIKGISLKYRVDREMDKIDLCIEDEHNIIVIENKIKSKINGVKDSGKKTASSAAIDSQLSKYKAKMEKVHPDKRVYCYIFTPDYNYIDLNTYKYGDKYKTIKYSKLYEFYNKHAGDMMNIDYFGDFLEALYLQSETHDNSNFRIMKSRFIAAIRRVKELQTC